MFVALNNGFLSWAWKEMLDLHSWQDMKVQGGKVTPGMRTIFQDVEIEMNISFCSFIQQIAIKQLFCAKHLSESRYSFSLWNLRTSGRDQH